MDLGCLCDTGSFYVDYNETEPEGIAPISSIEDNRKYIRQVYESREVKEVKFSDKDVSLFTFFLQLVNYLKFIGTVPAIDINAYLKAIHAKLMKIFKSKCTTDFVSFHIIISRFRK